MLKDMFKPAVLATAVASIMTIAAPAKADVSWEFITTSATPLCCSSPSQDFILSSVLTVSDEAFLRGGVHYSYTGGSIDPSDLVQEFGDKDFRFTLSITSFPLGSAPATLYGYGEANFSFSKNGKLSGGVTNRDWQEWFDMTIEDNKVTGATLFSDYVWTPYEIDGYWKLVHANHPLPKQPKDKAQLADATAIPEPGTLSILLASLGVLLYVRRRSTS
jgi:hypothetical protein